MTPIPNLPTINRATSPVVAHAAGLVCEHRPDLADEVRRAVLGGNTIAVIASMTFVCAQAADGQGISALGFLHGIVRCKNLAEGLPMLEELANVLHDSFEWIPRLYSEHADLVFPRMYLRRGFAPCWEHAKTPNDLRCLRRLITLHAHTVSLDATVRDAWAKAHIDALPQPQPFDGIEEFIGPHHASSAR